MAESRAQRPTWHIVLAVAGLAILWFLMLTIGAGPADERLLAFFYAGDRPLIAAVARVLTILGEGPTMILIAVAAAAWLLWRGLPRYGMAIIVVTLAGRFLVVFQKYGIGRLRPDEQAHLVPVHSPAFPSAHAANSMIVFLTIALVLSTTVRRRELLVAGAVLLSLLVGFSRILLGVHYPSDVLGGWAFGLLWVLLALPLANRFARR